MRLTDEEQRINGEGPTLKAGGVSSRLMAARDERGVGLIAAIFVIVVLAMLGTALVRVVSTEHVATTRSFASFKTYLAARTAQEVGLYLELHAPGNNWQDAASLDFSGIDGLSDCGIQGAPTPEHFGIDVPTVGGDMNFYSGQVTAVCYEGSPEETRRRLEVRWSQ